MVMRQQSSKPSFLQDATGLLRAASALIIVLALAYWLFGDDMGLRSRPQPTMREIEKQYISDLHWTYIKYTMWGLVLIALASGCAWLVVAIAADIRKRWLASQIVNGKLIDNYKYRDARGEVNRDTVVVDLDKMPEHTAQIHRNGTQAIQTIGHSDPVIQAQHSARVMQQRASKEQAEKDRRSNFVNGGQTQPKSGLTAAQMRVQLEDKAGVNVHKARLAAAQADSAELALFDRQQKHVAEQPPEPAPDWQPVNVRAAFSQGNETRLVVAQDQNGAGQLLFWEPVAGGNGVHGRIHGETRSGKTQLALGIVAQAIMQNWQVLILDRRKFKNYKQFEGYAQLVDTREPQVLLNSLKELERIHERRDSHLGRIGADNIDALPPQDRPRRILVLVDEFKAQMNTAKREDIADECLLLFETLTAEAGATGIHFLFCDQKPTTGHWGDTMRANVSFTLMGFMPKGQARTTTGNDLGDQLSGFRFWFERTGQFVKGWVVDDLWARNEAAGRFPMLPRPIIDVGEVIQQVERRQTLAEAIDDDPEYLALTDGVRDVVDYLLSVGFDDVDAIPTKGTAEGLNASEATVRRAKAYLRKIA